jgi:hypothetical protein
MFVPRQLRDKIEFLFPNERSTSKRKSKTYELLSDMFYQMQVNENRTINNVFLFQFPLSKETLKKRFKKTFYDDVFTKIIKANPGDDNYDTALLQSNGSYQEGEYPYSYRINPLYLKGNLVPINTEDKTQKDPDNNKIKGKKFRRTAKWNAQFMRSLSLNEEYIDQTTSRNYRYEYRTIYLSQVELKIHIVSKGNSERLELFNQVRSSKSTFLDSLFKIRMDHYFVFNKKESLEDNWGLQSIIKRIKSQIKRGIINNGAVIILYNGHLYVDSSIEVFLESVRFSFQLRAQYHLNLIRNKICNYHVSYTNGRVFTNLTSINKHYLNSMLFHMDHESCFLSTLDLKNAQPTILANLILRDENFITAIRTTEQKNLRKNLEHFLNFECVFASASEFLEMCFSGMLYEALKNDYLNRTGISLNRDFFKVEMLRVMFSKPDYYSVFIDLESRFPGFDRYLRELKLHMGYNEYGKNNLALLLQGVESFIFVESLHYEMAIRGIPGTTKHDCLIVPRDKDFKFISMTKELVECIFDQFNFKGVVSLEHTVKKIFQYPNREEFIIDRWDDKQSEILIQNYSNNPFFRGLI